MKLNTPKILIITIAVSAALALSLVTADSHNETTGGTASLPLNNFKIATTSSQLESTINTPKSFNAISFSWREKEHVDFDIYARFQKETWSEWQKMEIDGDLKDEEERIITRLFFTPYTNILQYKLVFSNPSDSGLIEDLNLNYIDSTNSSATYKTSLTTPRQDNGLNIITRAQWGANESLRFDESGNEIWKAEYYTPKKFVLHHTASRIEVSPTEAVRAIYYWHAKSNGWGDIGYNYLIDSNGNIYEGRYGGDGVVGAHAYMNNRNTIGIAVLGCYHPEKGCNTPDSLTPQTQEAINKLISVKSSQFGISPNGNGAFNDKGVISNIIGHKDLGHTNCPGDHIYEELSLIRDESAVRLAQIPAISEKSLSASLISNNNLIIEIPEGQQGVVTLSYKNTGEATWRGYADDHLIVSAESKKLGAIGRLKIATTAKFISGHLMDQGNIAPGEVGTFTLNLPAENSTKTYTLAWNKLGYFPSTDVTITTKVVASTAPSEPTFVPQYIALIESSTIPDKIPEGTNGEAEIKFYNLGNVNWERERLRLKITLEDGTPSPLFDQVEYAQELNIVEPNQSAVFKLKYKSSTAAEPLKHVINLFHDQNQVITFNQFITIISPYSGAVIEDNFPIAVKTSWRPTVILKIKNIGSKDWINPKLTSTDVDGTTSWFVDSSWVNRTTVQTLKKTVKPGEIAEFKFKIKPYWKPKTYPHLYKLRSGNNVININGVEILKKETRVDR